jgi:hypothetical protein
MRKIILSLGLTLGLHTLLSAGPTIIFNFEDGKQSTLTVPNGQRISRLDLIDELCQKGLIPEGSTVRLTDESMALVSPTQVFKGRVTVKLLVELVKLSKEDKALSISSPVSPLKKRHIKGGPSSPCSMR